MYSSNVVGVTKREHVKLYLTKVKMANCAKIIQAFEDQTKQLKLKAARLEVELFVKEKHGTATRKFSGKPYYLHPFAVAERLEQWDEYFTTFDQDTIWAAYLHDVLEDTDATVGEIGAKFGANVVELVQELTSDKSAYEEARKTDPLAKAKYLVDKFNKMSPQARIIKLADREDNVSDLANADPEFAKRYAKETQYIMDFIEVIDVRHGNELRASIREKIAPFLKG